MAGDRWVVLRVLPLIVCGSSEPSTCQAGCWGSSPCRKPQGRDRIAIGAASCDLTCHHLWDVVVAATQVGAD